MVPNSRKAEILKAVASGASLKEAADSAGISGSRARDLLSRICREMQMPDSVKDIQANPCAYLDKIDEMARSPRFELRRDLVKRLMQALRVRDVLEITPQYVSNITASQLLQHGITTLAITELQDWLSGHGLSLKKCAPKSDQEVKEVRRALALLEVFHFDTENARRQLSHLLSDEA